MLTRQKEISDLANCSYHNWYETFRKHCIKSVVIPIPPNVLKYLRDEFFILPKECSLSEGSSSSKFVGEESNFDDDDTETTETPEFPEFSKLIQETLINFGEFDGARSSQADIDNFVVVAFQAVQPSLKPTGTVPETRYGSQQARRFVYATWQTHINFSKHQAHAKMISMKS